MVGVTPQSVEGRLLKILVSAAAACRTQQREGRESGTTGMLHYRQYEHFVTPSLEL